MEWHLSSLWGELRIVAEMADRVGEFRHFLQPISLAIPNRPLC